MPVYLVPWEMSGNIPVKADNLEEALNLAKNNWNKETRNYSQFDVDFSTPKEITSLAQAMALDETIKDVEGDCTVYDSEKSLAELLPLEDDESKRKQESFIGFLKSARLLNPM